jgi:cytidine deaminase
MSAVPLPGGHTMEQLLTAARLAAGNAYVPYSHFPVGAALLTDDGEVITGVNVENASYGLTLCAERSAIVRAVSQGKTRFSAIAVWATECPHGAVTPCGACRQVLAEFLQPDALVIMSDSSTGVAKTLTMTTLLPEAFGLAAGRDGNCPDTNSSTPAG